MMELSDPKENENIICTKPAILFIPCIIQEEICR